MSAGAHATLPPAIRAARMLAAAVEARADLKHGAVAMEQAAWGVDPARAKAAARAGGRYDAYLRETYADSLDPFATLAADETLRAEAPELFADPRPSAIVAALMQRLPPAEAAAFQQALGRLAEIPDAAHLAHLKQAMGAEYAVARDREKAEALLREAERSASAARWTARAAIALGLLALAAQGVALAMPDWFPGLR